MSWKQFAHQNPSPDSIKNDFERLMQLAAERHHTSNCSVGNWASETSNAGTFVVLHNGETVVACDNDQIVDAKWGCRIADVEIYDILKNLLEHIPYTHLDPKVIRTDDCLGILGYEGPSHRIADIPGMEDIDYYRAWVISKSNEADPVKMDHIVYWDQGNTWCEVLAVFVGVTHEEFVAEMHDKYNEWIREESVSTPILQGVNDELAFSLDNGKYFFLFKPMRMVMTIQFITRTFLILTVVSSMFPT